MSTSEVAQLREKIELEVQAMRAALDGYAVVSRHELIHHKYDQIGAYVEQLQQYMGKHEAAQVMVHAFDRE